MEVSDASQRRRVDFLAVNLWQSRGHLIDGVEIKVARSDWVRELAHPKADSWYGVCNRWWLAVPQGVVHEDELPKTWGLLECLRFEDTWRMKVKVKAPELDPPSEWPNWLVMRLLTRVDERRKAEPEEIEALRTIHAEERARQYTIGVEHGSARNDPELRRTHDDLLRVLGLDSYSYRYKGDDVRLLQVKRAIELLDNGGLDAQATGMARKFREVADSIEAALAGRPQPDEDGIKF